MTRHEQLHLIPVGDTDAFMPSPQRPVGVRSRSMAADTHFEPHSHAWAQLAYCATGIVQVTAAKGGQAGGEVSYLVPPSRAVWIAPGAHHHITVLEAAELRTLYIDASATPAGWQGCRVIVVSPLLREAIHALDSPVGQANGDAREKMLCALVLDEITHADTQVLGVALPHPQTATSGCAHCAKRCCARHRTAPRWPNGLPRRVPANAQWHGYFAMSCV